MRKPNLLWTPLDYVSRPPLLEDFSVLDKPKNNEIEKPSKGFSQSEKTMNTTRANLPVTEIDSRNADRELRFKKWLQWSHEWSGSPPLNVSPLCRCDHSSSEQTDDCRLHGNWSDSKKSIVLLQTSSRSRRSSISESERSSSSSSNRDNESLISDPKLKLSQNLQENHGTQTQTQFNLGAWFLHTLNIPERLREQAADRNRLDVHKLPIHMKEQLKHIYVY